MAKYRISGVWKDGGTITHYALHTVQASGIVTKAVKTAKADAVKLLSNTANTAETRVWNYTKATWRIGEKVEVVEGTSGKFLKSAPDDSITDNLGHLIDYGTLS